MIPLFSTKLIREVDNYAIKTLKVPSIVLMENAAIEIFRYANEKLQSLGKKGAVGFICGKGNNAGDGFAAARHFFNHGFKVLVLYLFNESEMTDDAKTNFIILKKLAVKNKNLRLIKYKNINDLNILRKCETIFDAMLGSGIKGELKEPYHSIIKKVNSFNSFKVAIDIPTGLDSDKGYSDLLFHSDLTITLGELKVGLFYGDGYTYAGEIKKGSIGISPNLYLYEKAEAYLLESKDAADSLPLKEKSINKYTAGKVLTIAGSKNYSGAAVLTAKAALKAGAGASILAFPKSIRNFVHKNLGEVVLNEYNDDGDEYLKPKNIIELSERINWADVVAIGPGISREIETQKAVIKIVKERKFKQLVLDADALFAISFREYKRLDLSNCILTPHHGEFCSLTNIQLSELRKDVIYYGKKFVRETNSYLVLKGAPTIIFLPNGKVFVNSVGNPGMAKFGTGDVLTGVIAGLLSQLKDFQKAVTAGVYIHSFAADKLKEKFTEYSFTASDILNEIPSAIKCVRNSIVQLS